MGGFRFGNLPDRYLGGPLGVCFKNKNIWDQLLDRFRSRLAVWKRRYLSIGGRPVPIKSTLASLPVYLLSLLVIPISVAHEMEKIMKQFLWGLNKNKNKFYLVAWNDLCTPIEYGGLGLRRITDINVSLLCKWHWRFCKEQGSLWRIIITDKFGSSRRWFSKVNHLPINMSLWRGIARSQNIFKANTICGSGNGQTIDFWEDNWCITQPLKSFFPKLFALARKQSGPISDFASTTNNNTNWNCHFRRRLRDDEVVEAAALVGTISNIHLTDDEDKIEWNGAKGVFTVKDCNRKIIDWRCAIDSRPLHGFNKKRIWNKLAAPRVNFFMWLTCRGRIVTDDFLKRKGFQITSRCSLCNNA